MEKLNQAKREELSLEIDYEEMCLIAGNICTYWERGESAGAKPFQPPLLEISETVISLLSYACLAETVALQIEWTDLTEGFDIPEFETILSALEKRGIEAIGIHCQKDWGIGLACHNQFAPEQI